MRKKFIKLVLASILAFIICSCALPARSASEEYAANNGCRWNYILQHSWRIDESDAEMIRKNVMAEALANPNCAEVLIEAGKRNTAKAPFSQSAGEEYAANNGCRWNYILQHYWIDESNAEMIRKNAMAEALANPNCAEVLKEAGQRDMAK